MQNIESIAANYGVFVETLHKSRDGGFPAAARRQYIPGLSTNRQFDVWYSKLYEEDPFFEETIEQVKLWWQ